MTGVGFHEEMMILIGDRQVADLTINSQEEATFVTPPGPAGRQDVKALDSFGDSTIELGFTYTNELALNEMFTELERRRQYQRPHSHRQWV